MENCLWAIYLGDMSTVVPRTASGALNCRCGEKLVNLEKLVKPDYGIMSTAALLDVN